MGLRNKAAFQLAVMEVCKNIIQEHTTIDEKKIWCPTRRLLYWLNISSHVQPILNGMIALGILKTIPIRRLLPKTKTLFLAHLDRLAGEGEALYTPRRLYGVMKLELVEEWALQLPVNNAQQWRELLEPVNE